MPPNPKFTKTEIIDKAFQIARRQGIDKITARELGNQLGSSARPVFTVFKSMDELKEEVVTAAKALYTQYVTKGLQAKLAFQGVGLAYIAFAIEEPMLFQLLFMRAPSGAESKSNEVNVEKILPVIDENYDAILRSVQIPHGLSYQAAKRIYQHLWTYSHGIAAMCATGLCSYSIEQITERMAEVFKGLMLLEKTEDNDDKA